MPGFTIVAAHMHPSIPGSQSPELPTMFQAGNCDICFPLEWGRIVQFCQLSIHLANPLFFRRHVCLGVMCVSCPQLSPRAVISRGRCNAENLPARLLALPPPGTAAAPPPREPPQHVRCCHWQALSSRHVLQCCSCGAGQVNTCIGWSTPLRQTRHSGGSCFITATAQPLRSAWQVQAGQQRGRL